MTLIKQIKDDKFYLLLFTQLLFFTVLPFLEAQTAASNTLIPVLLSLILIAGINAISTSQRFAILGIAVAVFFALATILLEFEKTPLAVLASFLGFMCFFIFVIMRIVKTLLTTKEVKVSLLAGAFSGYLMIGVILSFFFIMLNSFDPNALSVTLVNKGFGGFLYFSLVTMTTIGYGDIAPINPIAQMVSVFAAIVSQFYLAIIVAILVGKVMHAKQTKSN